MEQTSNSPSLQDTDTPLNLNSQVTEMEADLEELRKKMEEYEKYVDELCNSYPMTYHKLKQFVKRGNCWCDRTKKPNSATFLTTPTTGIPTTNGPISSLCECTQLGVLCTCKHHDACKCVQDSKNCDYQKTNHVVRVYDINPQAITEESDIKNFLKVYEFDAGREGHLQKLKERLLDKEWSKLWEQVNDREDEEYYQIFGSKGLPCRLITVSHMSPNVAKMLGAHFDIPADFFNRHLPGTEAISGRLISRLPSSVQIDLDELYESTATFKSMWPNRDPNDGHKLIVKAMEEQFLYRNNGWDYFPISFKDWWSSRDNETLSNGFEVLKQDDLMNVFQFNLTHRISVYANPPGHPNTGTSSYSHSNPELF